MKQNKYNVLRIFPFLRCNFFCDYCTAYNQFNTPLKYKEFKTLPAQVWLDALNDSKIYDLFTNDYQIIISGGEPGLWKELKQFCDNLVNRNVVIYSNISKIAYNRLYSLEKPIKLYPSFHYKQEIKQDRFQNIHQAYRVWYRRLLDLKLCGHKIYMVHCPDDGSKEIQELASYVLKTKIEGIYKGEFYSPFVNECRVKAKEMQTVQCHTQHFCVAADGNIYNCQANMWSKREDTIMGNIQSIDWSEFPEWIKCDWCGACHICSQQKAIMNMNDELVLDDFQYKPILEQVKQKKVA